MEDQRLEGLLMSAELTEHSERKFMREPAGPACRQAGGRRGIGANALCGKLPGGFCRDQKEPMIC